jgi:hypothetical protein
MEYFIAAYLVLYFAKLPFIVAAAWRDTSYSVKQGYVQNTPWKLYMGSLVVVAAVMAFFFLVPMLFMENKNFFKPYKRETIEKAADATAEKYTF